MIYLDYNATTPMSNPVMQEITKNLSNWANPSSASQLGCQARRSIDKARDQICKLINAESSDEIVFESGGTEVNNHVIHSCINYYNNTKKNEDSKELAHIVTTNIEHDAINLPLIQLQKQKICEVTFVKVEKGSGVVRVEDIIAACKFNTCLVSVILANNETGVIQPVAEISKALLQLNSCMQKILFHTDAAQAIGKIGVNVQQLEVDFMTIVGHKESLEFCLFCGTENTPMICGLGCAAEESLKYLCHSSGQERTLQLKLLTQKLLQDKIGHVEFHCDQSACLPNTISVAVVNLPVPVSQFVTACCARGVVISAGAACHSSCIQPSRVLIASGISEETALKTVRISLGRETTKQDIETAAKIIQQVYNDSLI